MHYNYDNMLKISIGRVFGPMLDWSAWYSILLLFYGWLSMKFSSVDWILNQLFFSLNLKKKKKKKKKKNITKWKYN